MHIYMWWIHIYIYIYDRYTYLSDLACYSPWGRKVRQDRVTELN